MGGGKLQLINGQLQGHQRYRVFSGESGSMLCWGNVENYMKNIDNLGYFEKLFQSISNKKCMKLSLMFKYLVGFFYFFLFLEAN